MKSQTGIKIKSPSSGAILWRIQPRKNSRCMTSMNTSHNCRAAISYGFPQIQYGILTRIWMYPVLTKTSRFDMDLLQMWKSWKSMYSMKFLAFVAQVHNSTDTPHTENALVDRQISNKTLQILFDVVIFSCLTDD